MSYTEDDARELMLDILNVFEKSESDIPTANPQVKSDIHQLIRKVLKLTRSYKTIKGWPSSIHGSLHLEEENFVEAPFDLHKGLRITFGDINSDVEEEYNIKLFTGQELREFIRIFKHFLTGCNHTVKQDWKRIDMGVDDNDNHWYHYICKCGILQDVKRS